MKDSALVTNVVQFARTLRAAGINVGTGDVLTALRGLQALGVQSRREWYFGLRAVLIKHRVHYQLFDQAFHVYFRNPRLLEQMMGLVMPQISVAEQPGPTALRRLSEALRKAQRAPDTERSNEPELDMTLLASDMEQLKQMDFEQMSLEELAQAAAMLRKLPELVDTVATRRPSIKAVDGRIDWRETMKAARRTAGEPIHLVRRRPGSRPATMVLLCDISGSMSRYSRVFLHFAHAMARSGTPVQAFVFATRLTNITRDLQGADVDDAVNQIAGRVQDWSGGTRLAEALHRFNMDWSRRVLAQGATVILLSDGLEREHHPGLASEAARLRRSCRRLIWLNPLLRFAGFQPRAFGVRSLLPHVTDFRPAHNVNSLMDLVEALGNSTSSPPSISHKSGSFAA